MSDVMLWARVHEAEEQERQAAVQHGIVSVGKILSRARDGNANRNTERDPSAGQR